MLEGELDLVEVNRIVSERSGIDNSPVSQLRHVCQETLVIIFAPCRPHVRYQAAQRALVRSATDLVHQPKTYNKHPRRWGGGRGRRGGGPARRAGGGGREGRGGGGGARGE